MSWNVGVGVVPAGKMQHPLSEITGLPENTRTPRREASAVVDFVFFTHERNTDLTEVFARRTSDSKGSSSKNGCRAGPVVGFLVAGSRAQTDERENGVCVAGVRRLGVEGSVRVVFPTGGGGIRWLVRWRRDVEK